MGRKIAAVYLWTVFIWVWGIAIGYFQVFPYRALKSTLGDIENVLKGHEETGPELGKELLSAFTNIPAMHLEVRSPEFEKEGESLRSFPARHKDKFLRVDTSEQGQNKSLVYNKDLKVVHAWHLTYANIFPESEKAENRFFINDSLSLDDGSLIVNYNMSGIARVDLCGKVIWRLEKPLTHHSIALTERNTIWVPGRITLSEPMYGTPKGSFEDRLLEISLEDGKVIRDLSVNEILFKAELHGLYDWIKTETDFTHVNDIEELSTVLAPRFPMFEAGDLVVNAKRMNLVFVVDPDDLKVKWHGHSPWNQPHDPDFQSDGTITLFDNNQDKDGYRGWGTSRVLQIEPSTKQVTTLYQNPNFHSDTAARTIGPVDDMLVVSKKQGILFNLENKKLNFMFYRPYDDTRNYYISNAEWLSPSVIDGYKACNSRMGDASK